MDAIACAYEESFFIFKCWQILVKTLCGSKKRCLCKEFGPGPSMLSEDPSFFILCGCRIGAALSPLSFPNPWNADTTSEQKKWASLGKESSPGPPSAVAAALGWGNLLISLLVHRGQTLISSCAEQRGCTRRSPGQPPTSSKATNDDFSIFKWFHQRANRKPRNKGLPSHSSLMQMGNEGNNKVG